MKTEYLHIKIAPGLKDWTLKEAAKQEKTMSEYVRYLLEKERDKP